MSPFRHLPQHAARNPVAQAIQRAELAAAVRDMQIRILTMADGEPAPVDIGLAKAIIAYAHKVRELQGHGGTEATELLGHALQELRKMGECWASDQSPLIDDALGLAVGSLKKVSHAHSIAAWRHVAEVEGVG